MAAHFPFRKGKRVRRLKCKNEGEGLSFGWCRHRMGFECVWQEPCLCLGPGSSLCLSGFCSGLRLVEKPFILGSRAETHKELQQGRQERLLRPLVAKKSKATHHDP